MGIISYQKSDVSSVLINKTEELKRNNLGVNILSHEQTVLLKETHQRIRNNLNYVASYFEFKSETLNDPVSKNIFIESIKRVKVIALMHQLLYHNGNDSKVEMKDFVIKLYRQICTLYNREFNPLLIKIEFESDVLFSIDLSISIGLILIELITQTTNYDLTNNSECFIEIKLNKNISNKWELAYKDSRKVVPFGLDPEQMNASGMKLIKSVLFQIDGRIITQFENGYFCYIIVFKESK